MKQYLKWNMMRVSLFSSIFDMSKDNTMLFQLDTFSSDATNSNYSPRK